MSQSRCSVSDVSRVNCSRNSRAEYQHIPFFVTLVSQGQKNGKKVEDALGPTGRAIR